MKCLFLVAVLVSSSLGQLFPFPTTDTNFTEESWPWQKPTTTEEWTDQVPAPSPPEVEHDALRLRCQDENGTVPYWLDKTCRSYLACTSFNLSLQACQQGSAYSYIQRSCLPASEVNCSEQNREFTTIIRAYLEPHFYQRLPLPTRLPLVPFSEGGRAGPTFRDQLLGGGRAGDGDVTVEEGEDYGDNVMTIDLDDLPSILVDSSNAINISMPEDTCSRLGPHVKQLETSMNQALLMLVGCPEASCDVSLFRVTC